MPWDEDPQVTEESLVYCLCYVHLYAAYIRLEFNVDTEQ